MSQQRGMGRGLAAILSVSEAGEREGAELREVAVELVSPNPGQPRKRFDEDALQALAESVKDRGVLQPVLVRDHGEGYELIAGERRWRAARRVGLQTIPAIVRHADDAASLQQAIVENVQREALNPLEEAAAYSQLIEDFQLTHDDVAARVGDAGDVAHRGIDGVAGTGERFRGQAAKAAGGAGDENDLLFHGEFLSVAGPPQGGAGSEG